MIKKDLIKYSLESLRKRQKRSWLTVISVLIGIAAITSLISFGYGISDYVSEISRKMGNDKLIVQPRGFGFGPMINGNIKLDDSDLDAVENVKGVAEATGVYIISAEIEFDKQKKYGYLFGSDFKNNKELINEVYALDIGNGIELKGNEKTKAVLGYNYQIQDKIFEKPVKVRDKIKINGVEMKVAGFYQEVGNPQDDSNIYVTKDAAEEFFNATSYQFILVRAAAGKVPTELVNPIRKELRDERHQSAGNEDFFVQTFEKVIAIFNSILGVIIAVVVLIAAISVIVAAVNIMNTMYASILERTKEIGVFKAVGSRNSDILIVFITESALLSLIGGILGVILGYLVSKFAGNIVASAGYAIFRPLFTWELVVGSLLFALFVGIFAGLLPAYRASKLKPIDALRYE